MKRRHLIVQWLTRAWMTTLRGCQCNIGVFCKDLEVKWSKPSTLEKSDEVIKVANNTVGAVKLARILSWRNQWVRPRASGIWRTRTSSTWSQRMSPNAAQGACQHCVVQSALSADAHELELSKQTEAICSSPTELCCCALSCWWDGQFEGNYDHNCQRICSKSRDG